MRFRIVFLMALLASLALVWLYRGDEAAFFLLLSLVLVSGMYVLGLIRIWRRAGAGHGLPVWRATCFLGGMVILMVALLGPLDRLAEESFAMHMVQHVLLVKVVAPLLLLGEFSPVFLWALGQNAARWTGKRWLRSQRLNALWKGLTRPWTAWALFMLSLWLWHVPAFYQAALASEPIHALEHCIFLGTSMLFWWYLLQTGHDQVRRYGTAVFYLFTTMLQESILGGLLTFSSQTWYSFYSVQNPLGLSPLHDQQLAGLVMWLPGGILFGLLVVYYFGSWLQAVERKMRASPPVFMKTGDRNE